MRIPCAAALALAWLTSCHHAPDHTVASELASATPASAEVLAAQDRDCLQYPVHKLADGSEQWNADDVRYYLVGQRDQKLALGSDGKPVAYGVLHSDRTRTGRSVTLRPVVVSRQRAACGRPA